MKLARRDFLALGGGAIGGAALGRVTLRGISRLNEALAPEPALYPGEEKIAYSICSMCPGGCGLRVRTVGGRAIKVDGNPSYPVNRGGVCPRAQAMLQWVYHPDRVLSPRRRNKPDEPWEKTSWEDAVEALGSALRRLRAAGQQNRLLMISGQGSTLAGQLCSSFLSAYGGNPLFCLPTGMETTQQALELMAGRPDTKGGEAHRLAYDLENSRYLLNFGCDLLEGWGTPGHTLGLFGRWRDNNRGRRTTVVHFDSRLSVSAARSDQWVPMTVGAYGAAALGIAFVLISEDLYNRDFVANSTSGFEDWTDAAGRQHIGFRRWVREECRLSQVSEWTGIPSDTLVRVAREFAAGPGALAIGPRQSLLQPGRLSDAMAVQALNALVGSIGARGGVALLPDQGWTLPSREDGAKPPSASFERILAVLEQSPEVLILDEAGGLLDVLDSAHLEMLRRIPLVASTSSLEDETTSIATMSLPDCTPLEKWSYGQTPPVYPNQLLSIAEPVLPPRGESRPWAEVVLALAKATDPVIAARFPWQDLPALLRANSAQLAARQNGYFFGTEADEQWQRLLERSGWWGPDWSSAEQFWEGLRAKGGWWDPVAWPAEPQRAFSTPSGRFEFYSLKLDELLRARAGIRSGSQLPADWDRQVLPHHVELLPLTDPKQFEFVLEPYEPLAFFGGGARALPFLQQISAPYGGPKGWQSWVELNAEDARHRGIKDGDMVWVESARGKMRRRARVLEGSMPGIVGAPFGGAPQAGRWSIPEDSLAEILTPIPDPVLDVRSHLATRVNVYKV
ncbi:MAG: molybdopterin-dependent oxidoreductase [Acidobacteria bacterium]|nr:molybdopterin-dependent oxidoreductase [Acidobacteriota bacterium]